MFGQRLTLEEREIISRGLVVEKSFRAIGRELERPASTVSREVGRNGGRTSYRACEAHQAADERAERMVELLSSWSVPSSVGLLAGWLVDGDAVESLREEERDVISVAELGPPARPTAEFIERARAPDRTLVTADYRGGG